MGQSPRKIPARLGEKLLRIRMHLSLSQSGLLRHLSCEDEASLSSVSLWESGKSEPPLGVLLAYARAVPGLTVEALIDDDLDPPLPRVKLPKASGLKRKYSYRKSEN